MLLTIILHKMINQKSMTNVKHASYNPSSLLRWPVFIP